MEKTYRLAEIVERINGDIRPVGESSSDAKALANLEDLGEFLDDLVSDVYIIWQRNHDHYESSRIEAAEKAKRILLCLQDYTPQNNPEMQSENKTR